MIVKGNIYVAEENMILVRKSDETSVGKAIQLVSSDSIDNYYEREYTQEEYDKLYKINTKR